MLPTNCPCGSDNVYQHCCGLYIDQAQAAPTPEALMRSRYSAYTQANVDYIRKTMRGRAAKHFDETTAKQWALSNEWQKLEVIQSNINNDNAKQGFVEFKAYFRTSGQEVCMHELSEFEFDNGQWFYVNGQTLPRPVHVTKLGRNDPCSCGSGKKYKKCCALSIR